MKGAPLLLLAITLGLATGWLTSRSNGSSTADSEALAPSPTPPPPVTQARQWSSDGLVLTRDSSGHFHADVSVDGVTVAMLVDTGASVVALTGADAEAIGLQWRTGDIRPVAHGASGPVQGVPVMLGRIAVGDIELSQVQAIIVPEGLDMSLLGQSFLSRAGSLEMTGDVMVIGG